MIPQLEYRRVEVPLAWLDKKHGRAVLEADELRQAVHAEQRCKLVAFFVTERLVGALGGYTVRKCKLRELQIHVTEKPPAAGAARPDADSADPLDDRIRTRASPHTKNVVRSWFEIRHERKLMKEA
ncbi:MAG: hypothetical protein JNL38_12550 [Myxococcales bacterium]|nr:hypothetical protein [Myxococcales bacterium]